MDPLTLNCKDFSEGPEGWKSTIPNPQWLEPKDKYKALMLCEQWCKLHPGEDDGQLNWRMFEFALGLELKGKAKLYLERAIQKGKEVPPDILESSKQFINRIPG